ncbi:MAG: hypothetical protein J2P57_19220 [Acidimicrobiaceae bacterium]|nr:hypothetical protein [Acidimicrobiaceae bacterium]
MPISDEGSETPEERRQRLLDAMDGYEYEDSVLDALLAALEPPVADMVRYGVTEDSNRRYTPRKTHRAT